MMRDHAEQRAAGLVQEVHHGLAALAGMAQQADAEQHGEQQHLQDLALGEGVDHGVGDDVQQERR